MAIQYEQDNINDAAPAAAAYALYRSEENYYDNNNDHYVEEEQEQEQEVSITQDFNGFNEYNDINEQKQPPLLLFLQDQDLFFDDEELTTLLSKEQEKQNQEIYQKFDTNPSLSLARSEAVEWILKVHRRYSFAALTAVLAVDYLDRYLYNFHLQTDKQWMTQLAAVACLSLAAKIEETQVPLLLDLQVEDNMYLFEAKNVQRMEMLVLSSLSWKMNPVNPLSFIDYSARLLGFKEYRLCCEFVTRCEQLILFTISDSRSMQYAPSIMATATMLHVINSIKPSDGIERDTQLLDALGVDKDRVEECSAFMKEIAARDRYGRRSVFCSPNKRKFAVWSSENNVVLPSSPTGVIDMSFSSSDNSGDAWSILSSSLSASSSPEPLLKKNKAQTDAESFPLDFPR